MSLRKYINHARLSNSTNELVSLLNHQDFLVRLGAATALSNINPSITEGIPNLIDGVLSQESGYGERRLPNIDWIYPNDIRSVSAQALGNIGHAASQAIPALIKLLGNPETDMQDDAISAIINITDSDQDIIVMLYDLSESEDLLIRRNAIRILGMIGPPALIVLPDLQEILQNENEDLVKEVESAIEAINQPDDL